MSEETLEEIKYYSEMYPDGIHKKSQAKEIFEKLGYKLVNDNEYFLLYEYQIKENAEFENDYLHISFEKKDKAFIKTYGDDNTPEIITMEELQAINKQVEELGWNK